VPPYTRLGSGVLIRDWKSCPPDTRLGRGVLIRAWKSCRDRKLGQRTTSPDQARVVRPETYMGPEKMGNLARGFLEKSGSGFLNHYGHVVATRRNGSPVTFISRRQCIQAVVSDPNRRTISRFPDSWASTLKGFPCVSRASRRTGKRRRSRVTHSTSPRCIA
jgi:hypothetical protein